MHSKSSGCGQLHGLAWHNNSVWVDRSQAWSVIYKTSRAARQELRLLSFELGKKHTVQDVEALEPAGSGRRCVWIRSTCKGVRSCPFQHARFLGALEARSATGGMRRLRIDQHRGMRCRVAIRLPMPCQASTFASKILMMESILGRWCLPAVIEEG